MTARDDVLARIRDAHTLAPPGELQYADIARDYRQTSDDDQPTLIERLVDRLLDYKALVRHTAPENVATTVGEALIARGARTAVVPPGIDPNWLTAADVELRIDGGPDHDQLSVSELDVVDAVITGCAVAVAETGTLILDGSADQGRRVISLIPDYHLCIFRVEDLCADVPQAIARLEATRPLTMISGPSATSDIELNRVEGVHGPRTLEVIIVE